MLNKQYFQNYLIYLSNLNFIIIALKFIYLIFYFNNNKLKLEKKPSLYLNKII